MKIFVALVMTLFGALGLTCFYFGVMALPENGFGYTGIILGVNFLFFAWKGWAFLQELRGELPPTDEAAR